MLYKITTSGSPLDHYRWDEFFMRLAREASKMSKDPSTQVGSVIAQGKELLSLGFNGFPPGIADDSRLFVREDKYKLMVHAEMNALHRCSMPLGSTLYCFPLPPCSECAKHIISCGIGRVVFPEWPAPKRWQEDIDRAQAMMAEAGLRIAPSKPFQPAPVWD